LQLTGAPSIAVSAYDDLLITSVRAHICADRPQLNSGVSMQHASRAAMELPCIQRSIAVGQPIERRMPAPRD